MNIHKKLTMGDYAFIALIDELVVFVLCVSLREINEINKTKNHEEIVNSTQGYMIVFRSNRWSITDIIKLIRYRFLEDQNSLSIIALSFL